MFTKESIKRVNSIPIFKLLPDVTEYGNKTYCRCPGCGEHGKVKSKINGMKIEVDDARNANRGHCFQCGLSLNGAINTYCFLNGLKTTGEDFIRAVKELAEQNNITLEEDTPKVKKYTENKPKPGSFAFRQLKDSGLTPDDVTAEVIEDGKKIKICTFQTGAIKTGSGDIDDKADEMIILYYDLEGRRKKYLPNGAKSKEKPYARVRWSNPEAKSIDGKPVKYQTPAGAKAEFYIPEFIRQAYKEAKPLEYLFIQEGEKKAEKACKHGIPSIAIQGIYNIGRKDEGLPLELQYLVKRCDVKNIVLLFDSDWMNLSSNLTPDDNVDYRPRQFAKAAIKFRKFIKTLHIQKMPVDIWFGHINENEHNAKGIDDLLVALDGKEAELKDQLKEAALAHDGQARLVSLHNITTDTDYKILDYWALNSKQEFFRLHEERLKDLKNFRFDRVFYTVVNGEIKQASEYGTGKEFWEIDYSKEEAKIKLSIIGALDFLAANGFYSHIDEEGKNSFVRVENGIISKFQVPAIHRYIFSYVQKATKDLDVHEFMASVIDTKLSQAKLNLLEPLYTNAGEPEEYRQRFFYRNAQITISTDGIAEEPLTGPVWEQNLIRRKFKRIRIFENIQKLPDGSFLIKTTPEGKECDFLNYLIRTSTFSEDQLPQNETAEAFTSRHLINKITALGYLLRSHRPYIESKAVVAMDARMSEVGDSNGRSGKSLIGVAIAQMIPQVKIDGRQVDSSDPFLFGEVRKTTRNIFIDDVKVNFNIGDLYSALSSDLQVNIKKGERFTIPFLSAPKIFITTNHAIKSEGDSTEDRIVYMAFSQYYNIEFSPAMDFGHQFFSQWDENQWMLFDNLMAECVYWYMKSQQLLWGRKEAGAIDPPMEQINARRERQTMGEAFLQWAEEYFAKDGTKINTRIFRREMFDDFHSKFKGNLKFVSQTQFRKKLIAFCQFKNLHLNAHRLHEKLGITFREFIAKNPNTTFIGKEEKTQGKEYFTVSEGEISPDTITEYNNPFNYSK